MLVDLIQITAEDGLRLDGAYHAAPAGSVNRTRFDALVCVHGTGSNFYSSSMFVGLTPHWLELGINVLWANTRGHDGLSHASTTRGRRKQGAAFERFSESQFDLHACADWLRAKGCARIAYFGHSAGAVKSIYSQAVHPHPAVTGVIAASPPQLSYSYFAASSKKGEFLDAYRRAEMLIAAGEPHTLMEVTFPLSYTISASAYIEKYGPAEDFNVLNLLPQVACPTLVTFGALEVEREVAFQQMPAAVAAVDPSGGQISVRTIEAADHLYTGRLDELGRVLEPWLIG